MKREEWNEDYRFYVDGSGGEYNVSLPHQCDSWEILCADYDKYPPTKEEAVKQMELFVKRATEALEKLKEIE